MGIPAIKTLARVHDLQRGEFLGHQLHAHSKLVCQCMFCDLVAKQDLLDLGV